ncbi:MAG: DUF1800 family protein [Betaproteobacteria bacterium]|nr:DUF1800 family protein [Betaproteobacteria bacterium]
MAQPIHQEWDGLAPFHGRRQNDLSGDYDCNLSADKSQRRIWRVVSWVLLANVIAFWLLTCATAFAQSVNPANWAPVYLSYSPYTGSYGYGLNGTVAAGWRSDDAKFMVKMDAGAIEGQPVLALNKLTLPGMGRTVLTTDAGEVASLRSQGWQQDGVLGYVGGQPASGLVALYRVAHDGLKLNVYTLKSPSKDFLIGKFGWRNVGIVGYVLPPGSTATGTPTTPPSIPSAPVPAGAPTVTSFAPASAAAGTMVTINGSNFLPGSTVKFNGVASSNVNKVSSSVLQATVPTGATSGKIVVVTTGGSATSGSDFVVTSSPPTSTPTIASFEPQSGVIGSVVTITGTNLTGATSVKFNGTTSSTISNVTATSLQAAVPNNASSGKITIVTPAGSVTSSTSFTVTAAPPPTIASFAPTSGAAGAVVTLTGTNLTGASAVRFNGVASTAITNVTATSLQATVPLNAASGRIVVVTAGGTATSSVDFVVTAPPTTAVFSEPARFLTQATFGPKAASVERVKAIGIPAWIDEQLARPADSHMAYIDAAKARRLAEKGKAYYAEEDSYEAIWQQWLTGQDELRARMSFALSEIMVISNIAPDLEPDAMSTYMDLLNTRAFGTYRELLGAVTLNPAMGYYLNMLGSEKEDGKNKFPNENYAREVLQLFSVGLYQLNPDGSRKLDGNGVPLATYDEGTVKGFARAFTGWTFFGNDPNNPKKFDRPEESWTQPMIAFPSKHEPGTKKLLNGVVLPAGQTPQKDLSDALDNIANHPNVGPFIGRQLIQRFVTSNPSPAYIARISAVFDNNGRGVRGDLGAVIKAVLTDPDARNSALIADAKFGKQREPVIRFANILRAFNATSVNGRNNIHYLDSADDALGQSPLLSPSVFNFFSPSYTRPGKLAQAAMVAPEFQITNEIQTVGTANFFYELVKNEGYGSGDSRQKLNLTEVKALANNPAALVDHLSGLLTYGNLSAGTRQVMIDAVTSVPFNNRDSDRTWRVRTALTLFALSSDFVIQK